MATESRIRIIESSNKWPSCEDAAACWQSSANMAVEELGLVMRNQRFQGNGRNMVPNRSESAPPSMEGSLTAVHNLVSQQKYIVDASLPISNNAAEGCEPAEEFRVNSAYLSYYSSNTDLNARTRPPLISLENQRNIHHIGSIGNNWRLTSFDDTGTGSLRLSCSSLPIHEEETEEDRSSQLPPDEWAESSSEIWSRQEATLSGQPSSLVDLLQENASHSSSPVYNKSRSISYESVQVDVDCDAESSSLHNASVSTSNANASIRSSDNKGLTFYADAVTAPVSGSPALSSTGAMPAQPPIYKRHLNARVAQFEDKILNSGLGDADFSHIESQMKNMGLSSLPTAETHNNQKDRQYGGQVNLLQSRSSGQANMQHRNTHCVQGVESQIISQGLSHACMNTNQVFHGPSNFSAAEARPIMQPSGFTPLYGTAAAYITSPNPLYPNEQPSGYFSPQYNISGYAFNPSDLPPFVAGYAPHSAIPVAFNATSGISFSPQTSGIPSGGSAAHVVDVQHLNKFYTQFGYAMQPSFPGALHMQYFQHPFGNAYGMSGQFDHLASRHSPLGSQVTPVESQKGAELASDSQKILHHGTVGYGNLNTRSGGFMNNYYSGGPTTICTLMPFQNSPVPSPVLPGSSGGKTEARLPPGVGRNSGIYSGWQGQGIFGNTKRPSILEELKSGKGRRFELSDIAEHVIEFSADQHGSRFIQQKLENCSPEEKASVFKEVLPHASKLMTDVFGNYVIQKFFEYGSPDQRRELANQLEGQILPLSLQMYGCRVIQKALEVIELKQKTKLVRELDGHVMRCVHDQNGNHVIQKCIESIPTDKIAFIISSFRNQVATLSTHPYGCRVIQRVLEHCSDELQSQFIVDEILESVYALAQDQYGNYVTQHVLERGRPNERSQIISKLSGHIVQLSQHKFASNVIEKSLEHSDLAAREILIGEIIGHGDGNDNLLIMMKDQYANYVVQKILKMCSDDQREMLLPRVRVHLNALKKYTYGKHIVARFEQLYGQEIQTLGS